MTLPTFDATKHDIGINGVGYMLAAGQKQDLRPGTTRASAGEGRFDSFESESFNAQSEFGGGAGQQRFAATDSFGSSIGDGRYGRFFPARKFLTSQGGATSHLFNIGSTTYGINDTTIDTIGTATTVARTAGTVYGKPVVSGNDRAFWVQDVSGTKRLYRFDGANAPTDVMPYQINAAGAVARYGRSIWLFGSRRQKSTPAIVQSVLNASENTATVSWPAAPTYGNQCFVIVVGVCDDTDSPNPTVTSSTGATYTKVKDAQGVASAGRDESYTSIHRIDADPAELSVTLSFTGGGAGTLDAYKIYLLEVEGLEGLSSPSLDAQLTSTDAPGGSRTAIGDSNVYLPEAKEWVLSVWNIYDAGGGITGYTLEGAFTELVDETVTTALNVAIGHKTTTAIEDTAYSVTLGGSTNAEDTWSHITLVYEGSKFDEDTDLFCLAYSNDDGSTWGIVDSGTGTGIEIPGAALATQGALWFTTPTGLYKMSLATEGDASTAVVTGPYDEWQVPHDTTSVGTSMGQFEGLFYYNVGATLRQYAPGGIGRQLWPPADWATVAGEVTSVVGSEGGVYFGAGGYLWNYNGRGFQALAAEPASGAFDSLHFAGGNLYCLGATVKYIQFRYPSMRPDIWMTDGSNFDIGYLVMSELDFEKVNVIKVIRNFEIHGYFVGTPAGSIALHYMTGCAGNPDPLSLGGGATTATWTSIGSLTSADGGIKTIQLATPVVCKRLYLRATLTPSATGFPVLQAITAYGRALMPTDNRFALTLRLAAGATDRQGGTMYATDDDVDAAVDALRALRQGTSVSYFNVVWVNADGTTSTFVATPDEMTEPLVNWNNQGGAALQVNFVVSELP